MSQVSILKGDITVAEVDAIVNAANPIMLGGGGVDGAIHKKAGPKLLEACQKIKATNGIRCEVGNAQITIAGELATKYVIHTVGPRFRVDDNPAKKLCLAYQNSLELATSHKCRSIAFPAISCGAYGYPHYEAAEIALSSCMNYKDSDLHVSFYLYDDNLFNIWFDVHKTLSIK